MRREGGGSRGRAMGRDVRISYLYKAVLIKFVGTNTAYDRIDPERI